MADRRRTEYRLMDTEGEEFFDLFQAADAAAHFDRDAAFAHDALDGGQVAAFAGERPVKVHHMDGRGPFLSPLSGHGAGIPAVYGFLVEFTLQQADALAAAKIDGRIDVHGFHSLKAFSIARPAAEDFSGWNWKPWTLSLPTEATMVVP